MKTKHEILEEYSRSYTGEILPTIHVTVALDAMEEYANQFVPSVEPKEPDGYLLNGVFFTTEEKPVISLGSSDDLIPVYLSPVSSDKKKVETGAFAEPTRDSIIHLIDSLESAEGDERKIEIITIWISNHTKSIPFYQSSPPFSETAENKREAVEFAEWISINGWRKYVVNEILVWRKPSEGLEKSTSELYTLFLTQDKDK